MPTFPCLLFSIEQRKGYTLISFTCGCGNRGRRRYYKNSFKPLCRKCLREHNQKERVRRNIEFGKALRRAAKTLRIHIVEDDYFELTKLWEE